MDTFRPLHSLANFFSYDLTGLDQESYLGSAAEFFVYDTIKIGLLLLAINYLMAVIRHYFPLEKARNILSRGRWRSANYLIAAALGAVTPFCSCSSIPLFIGFTGAGIPLGVTFTFLISSPLINESSLYLFPTMFGFKAALIYNLAGVGVAIASGLLIQRLKLEKYLMPELVQHSQNPIWTEQKKKNKTDIWSLIPYFWQEALSLSRKLFPYVILGVAAGAVIHGFIPDSLIQDYLATKSWWTVPLAVLLGAPLYANSISVVPIMEAIADKGAPLGTALAFMTAIVTLSIPEALILKRVMRLPLLIIFFSLTIAGIMIMGFLLNAIL